MWPKPGPLGFESDALPTALRGTTFSQEHSNNAVLSWPF